MSTEPRILPFEDIDWVDESTPATSSISSAWSR